MKFSRKDSDIYVPDGSDADKALARSTHLSVVAHQDDIEVMAHEGIAACHGRTDRFFTGVVVTNGAGSARTGRYAGFTDLQMQEVRREEQREAARLGKYSLQIQLSHPSADVKKPGLPGVAADLAAIFAGARPQVVYLHNPADKHDTHVAVFLRCIEAIRSLPMEQRPGKVLGCEGWRNLDWLLDSDKAVIDTSAMPELAAKLLLVFDSQISGGKRYDLAVAGRRAANATFLNSHAVDTMTAATWAMDLTPLVRDDSLPVADYTLAYVDRLRADVAARLARYSRQG
jgi:LmbE family N-acetylglucosaminyl deacetylase